MPSMIRGTPVGMIGVAIVCMQAKIKEWMGSEDTGIE
jgi:hypothetical protein